jgi:hypothetical protein
MRNRSMASARSTRPTLLLLCNAISTGNCTFSSVVRHGSSNGFWNIMPTCMPSCSPAPCPGTPPAILSSPPATGTRPAIARRMLDLPQPLGPSKETNSPLSISSDTPPTASTSP